MKWIIRVTKVAAPAIMAVSLVTACGSDGSDGPTEVRSQAPAPAAQTGHRQLAAAERLERQAKLDGQARTYSDEGETSDEELQFVPGSRHMPTR